MDKRQVGQAIEQYACAYLRQHGLILQQANYRCKYGEIDLIMTDQDDMVFVEVRYRSNADYGDGAASISASKQSKIIKSATHYLVSIDKYDKIPCRFDVIDVSGTSDDYQIDWIRDAFQIASNQI